MMFLTLIAAVVSFVIGPALTVECSLELECEAIVYPNTSTAFLVLAVDVDYLDQWEKFSVPGGWGVRLWFDPPACVGSVARIRLMEGEEEEPPGPRPPRPTPSGQIPPEPTLLSSILASYDVAAYCSLLPLVNK